MSDPSSASPPQNAEKSTLLEFRDADGKPIPLPPEIWTDLHPAAKARILNLIDRVRALEERLGTNSTNSSKPPSSDMPNVKRRKKEKSGKRQGAQPGHVGFYHELLPDEEVTEVVDHLPDQCEHCHGILPDDGPDDPDPVVHQVLDIPPRRRSVVNHRLHARICPLCKKTTRAALPPDVPKSSYGPGVWSTATYFTGRLRCTRREVVQALDDLHDIPMSTGTLNSIETRASEALAPAVAELRAAIQEEPVVNADETHWREENKKAFIWIATTSKMAVYHVNKSRSQEVAKQFLGAFHGILGTDRYAGYRWYPIGLRQICHAHLKRDFQKMVDRGGPSAKIGQQALDEQGRMFGAWYAFIDGKIDVPEFRQQIKPIRARMKKIFNRGADCAIPKAEGTCKLERYPEPERPKTARERKKVCSTCPHSKTMGTCKNLNEHFPALWTFVYEDDVEPTNNTAEHGGRKAVLWRNGSFGTQSPEGSRFVERFLTAVETCRRQGRNFFSFLEATINAAFTGTPRPSLLPAAGQVPTQYVNPPSSPAVASDTS